MTREEALSQYDEIDRRTRSIRPYWEVRDIFIKIFDDFEELSGSKQLVDNHKTCEGCKYYEARNYDSYCHWCERHPSRLTRNINIRDYWESKE